MKLMHVSAQITVFVGMYGMSAEDKISTLLHLLWLNFVSVDHMLVREIVPFLNQIESQVQPVVTCSPTFSACINYLPVSSRLIYRPVVAMTLYNRTT